MITLPGAGNQLMLEFQCSKAGVRNRSGKYCGRIFTSASSVLQYWSMVHG